MTHDQTKLTQKKLELWMILKISLRAKAGVPKTLVKRKLRLHSLYFPQNTLMLTESRGQFSDSHSVLLLDYVRFALLSRSTGDRVRLSHDWFWFYF